MDSYRRWADVPAKLKTKTQLKEMGLKPAKDQKPVAIFDSPNGDWKLYDLSLAIPRQQVSEARRQQLAAARKKLDRLRHCGSRYHCFESLSLKDYGASNLKLRPDLFPDGQYICRFCRDRKEAAGWAREVLADPGAVILDSETTGLDGAEIVEVAIINTKGELLFESLVKPHGPMGATHIHGITEEMVKDAPTWAEIDSEVLAFLQTASRVVVYNASFDSQMIDNSRNRWGLPDLIEVEPLEKVLVDMEGSSFSPDINWQCAMEWYAQWYGDWVGKHGIGYKWKRLEGGGHRAAGDCRACLEYLKRMAKDED